MGLPSLLTSPEFLHFTHLLKTNPRDAYGYLDYSWLIFNISGQSTYPTVDYLEGLLHWQGKRGALAAAMLKAGFLEKRRNGALAIANPESRLQEWGRKRMQRAAAADGRTADNGGRSAPKRRPTDPDPVSPSPRLRVLPTDDDPGATKDRDRPNTTRRGGGSSHKNPQQAVQELASGLSRALGRAQGRPTRPGAPGPEVPIGAYTAKDCALAAAALDTRNDDDTARAMWITRAAELSTYPGGLEYFRDLLAAVHNARHCGAAKGVGAIHNPGAYLNAKTAAYLEQRRSA